MMLASTWSELEYDLIETLCCRVRVLSLEHIARGWWPNEEDMSHVKNCMNRLVSAGLLQSAVWQVHVTRLGDSPIFAWRPTLPSPDFEQLTRLVRNRWSSSPRHIRAYVALPKAARLFGSSAGSIPPVHHRNHDLLLAAVFIHYRTSRPNEWRRWLGEDALPIAETGIKNPDAFLLDTSGRPCRVIESAGRYSQNQIEEFHKYCRQNTLPYELW
jgi:hypothetical protein